MGPAGQFLTGHFQNILSFVNLKFLEKHRQEFGPIPHKPSHTAQSIVYETVRFSLGVCVQTFYLY